MALPTGWTEHTSIDNGVKEYKNWSWSGEDSVIGTPSSGKALFDFRVYPFISGNANAEVEVNDLWAVNFGYRVVDISGTGRGFQATPKPTQQRLIREILMLSYATVNPLPKRGDSLFKGEGNGDYAIGALSNPVVDTISITQEGETPDVWLITYRTKKRVVNISRKPTASENVPSMRDPYPWERRPKVKITSQTENYQIGWGYFLGNKTPTQIATALNTNMDGIAGMLTAGVNDPYEIIKNSAGDPFKSPPPSKITVTNIEITVAFEASATLTSLIANAKSAAEFVNNAQFSIGVNSALFSVRKGTAMLTGFGVLPADYQDKRDWLPNQLHPFEKTYGNLGWTVSGESSTSVAVNKYGKTLVATRNLAYTQVSIAFSVREIGWGTIIPDRGYRSLKTGVIGPIQEKDSSKSEERLLNGSGIEVDVEVDTTTIPCLRLYTPFGSDDSLYNVLDSLPWSRTEV